MLILTAKQRTELKRPLGTLIKGTPNETMSKFSRLIQKEKPTLIISVGDVVSQNMLKHGISPQLIIVDSKIMRAETEPFNTRISRKMRVRNPAGTLTPETWAVLDKALEQKDPVQVTVDGEEDLLTLVAVLKAPQGSLVIYGQPREGVVAVKVDKTMKERVLKIVSAMKQLPKA